MALCQRLFESLIVMITVTLLVNTTGHAQTRFQQAQSIEQPQLVKLNVLITDDSNRPVNDLGQGDFRISENGLPQTISFFSKEEPPLIYGLLIDNSGSFKDMLKPIVAAAKIIVRDTKPADETLIVRFVDSKKIEFMQDFTSDKAVLSKSLDKLFIEGGETAVIDAVYVTAQRISQYKKDNGGDRRRAIILITDGEDRDSYYKKDKLIELLGQENVQVFVIGIVGVLSNEGGMYRSPREGAVSLLNSITKESGGLVFFPKSLTELQSVANQIMTYLRTQYVIGYTPSNSNKEGKDSYRKVEVKIVDAPGRKKRVAITRSGYIASQRNK